MQSSIKYCCKHQKDILSNLGAGDACDDLYRAQKMYHFGRKTIILKCDYLDNGKR